MKNIFATLILGFFAVAGCNSGAIAEPKNVIERDVMVDIIYDLSVLEAMRSINASGTINYPKANDYIKKNYKIDSLTFAQNSKFYASNPKEYKKMYDEVKERLLLQSAKLNGGNKQVQEQGVKN